MNVKELIEHLQKQPPEAQVILAKDSEGNDYSPLDESFSTGVYVAESNWSGSFFSEDELEEGDGLGLANAIVLWPNN